jgi:hypothetical protein
MLKKISLLIVATIVIKMFGMATNENSLVSNNQSQIDYIKSQMSIIGRAWKSERLRIKMAQKASPTAYQTMSPIFDKIIASNDFTTRLNSTVSNLFDSIVNGNVSFSSIKTDFNVSDFFPNATVNDYGKKLFTAMANKMCFLELGKKLAQKMQELQILAPVTTAMP